VQQQVFHPAFADGGLPGRWAALTQNRGQLEGTLRPGNIDEVIYGGILRGYWLARRVVLFAGPIWSFFTGALTI
jgi:hypothetical protein